MHSLSRLGYFSSLLRSKNFPTNQIKQVHAQLIVHASKSPSIFAKLIEQYCANSTSKLTNFACLVVTHFDPPSVYLLNVLIKSTPPRQSLLVFSNWVSKANLVFDDFTYTFALGACARCSALSEGKQMHCRVMKDGLMGNVMIQTTAIHFYGNCQDVLSARKLFDEMPVINSVTWTSLIAGYCSQRERVSENARSALILFKEMLVDGYEPSERTMVCVLSAASGMGFLKTGACIHGYVEKTVADPENDVYFGTGLVDMYAKCGSLDFAFFIFMRMRDKNVLTWTAMTTGLALHGKGEQALRLLDTMGAYGIRPNEVTFTSVLLACCHAGLVEEGLFLFHSLETKFRLAPQMHHYGCIVDLLGRAGNINEAYEFIVSNNVEGDVVLWKSLLHSCGVHGDVAMGEKVAKILIAIQPEKKLVGSTYRSEDYVAFSNICASAERWEDVAVVREVMDINRMETKPASSVLA